MTLLQKRITALAADLQKTVFKLERDVSSKDVHRLRTTIRRLESLIRYANPEVSHKQQKAIEELASLRKRAGKVRDLDIQIGLLGAIANGSTGKDRRMIADYLKMKRQRQAIRLTSDVRDLEYKKLFLRLEKISEKSIIATPDQHENAPMDRARSELIQLARKTSLHSTLKDRKLHGLRISLKRIRYTAELAEESEDQRQMLEELKPVQDALGEWHDWETLVRTAEKQFKGRINCPLLVEMRSLLSARFSSATSAVDRLFSRYASAAGKTPASVPGVPQLVRHA
jgi:CHAD domain-containing protein